MSRSREILALFLDVIANCFALIDTLCAIRLSYMPTGLEAVMANMRRSVLKEAGNAAVNSSSTRRRA
jgi:hypothetical protein